MYNNQLETCFDINPDNDCNANKSISCAGIRHSWYNENGCIKFIIRKNWDESKEEIKAYNNLLVTCSWFRISKSRPMVKTFNGNTMLTLIYSQFLNAEMNVILRYRNAPHPQQKNTQKNNNKTAVACCNLTYFMNTVLFVKLTQENVWY